MRTEFLCISVLRVASGPRVKLTSCKRPNGPLKQGLRNICLKSKKQRKLIRFFINISGVLIIHDHLVKFWFNLLKKLYTSPILPKNSKIF